MRRRRVRRKKRRTEEEEVFDVHDGNRMEGEKGGAFCFSPHFHLLIRKEIRREISTHDVLYVCV
jgi:hypothetical protein